VKSSPQDSYIFGEKVEGASFQPADEQETSTVEVIIAAVSQAYSAGFYKKMIYCHG
jgi:hypothetical protein